MFLLQRGWIEGTKWKGPAKVLLFFGLWYHPWNFVSSSPPPFAMLICLLVAAYSSFILFYTAPPSVKPPYLLWYISLLGSLLFKIIILMDNCLFSETPPYCLLTYNLILFWWTRISAMLFSCLKLIYSLVIIGSSVSSPILVFWLLDDSDWMFNTFIWVNLLFIVQWWIIHFVTQITTVNGVIHHQWEHHKII